MPGRPKLICLLLVDALKHSATTATDADVITTSLRRDDGWQVIEDDEEDFASLSWSSSSQHSDDSPEASQLPQHFSGVMDGEEQGLDEESQWLTETGAHRYTDESFDESDGEDVFNAWAGDEYDRPGFLRSGSTSWSQSRDEEGTEGEFEDLYNYPDGADYYYRDEGTFIDISSSSELAEKDIYRHDEEYEHFDGGGDERLEGLIEADQRILQSNAQCANRYRQLKRRLEGARSGQTVPMTCGRYCANSNQPIAVRSSRVTLSCVCPNSSCVIDKMGRPRRIMTVWGDYFTVQGVEFKNAVTPQGGGAAILNHGLQAKIVQCTFRNLRAPNGDGGAVHSRASGTLLIQDSLFVNNEARIGGAASIERGRSDRLGRDRGTANDASVRCEGLWFEEENRCVDLTGGGPIIGGGRNCVSTYDALRQRMASGATDICIRSNSIITVPKELFLTTDRATLRCSDPSNYFGRVGSCILTKQGGRGRILTVEADETIIEGISFQESQNLGNNGGAVLVKGDLTIFRNCDFRANKATRGGGIFAEENMQVSLTGCSFRQNEAVRGGAGFFYFSASRGVDLFGSNTLANNGLVFTGVNNFASGNSARQCSYLYQDGSGLCIMPS